MEHDFEGINLHFPVECNRIDGSLSPATYYLLAGSVFILMNQLVRNYGLVSVALVN